MSVGLFCGPKQRDVGSAQPVRVCLHHHNEPWNNGDLIGCWVYLHQWQHKASFVSITPTKENKKPNSHINSFSFHIKKIFKVSKLECKTADINIMVAIIADYE